MVAYYGETNQIRQIVDETGQQLGYPCVSGTYLYDYNGNMTYDPSKFLDITYNRFNLPLTVTSAVSERIRYTYSTSGVKLRKEYSTLATPGSRVTDYCDEFLYEDNELVCIFTPFGRITPMETPIDTQWRTSYSLTDHLGNVRAEFVAHSGGQAELLQQTDYYPYGYTMRRNDYAGTRPNHHLYGGKELQDETVAGRSLEWYDFEARMYDPLIGRFLSTDPLANDALSWTPYNAMWNNPLRFVDPTGTWSIDHIEVSVDNNNNYVVQNGVIDDDLNIYIVEDGIRTGEILGQMMTAYSFFSDQGNVITGAVIDPNNNSGRDFLEQIKNEDPNLLTYIPNAVHEGKYDFKTSETIPNGMTLEKHANRGMPITENENYTVYGTARDIGNYAAGFVSGRNGLSWNETRIGFDAYQTGTRKLLKGEWSPEPQVSQAAQRLGFDAGIKQRSYDIERKKQLTPSIPHLKR